MKHYLISTTGDFCNWHAYLMTRDKKIVMRVIEKLMEEAQPRIPIILQTEITGKGDPEMIRDVITRIREKQSIVEDGWFEGADKKGFACVIFSLGEKHPDNIKLMELH